MPAWDNDDFDREASTLARTFWAGHDQNGSALNELATKVARDHNLNPEQIRRLCRNANTKAFEQKFAALKGEPDRTPVFDLADAEAVISQMHQDVMHAHAKQAEALAEYPDLGNEYAPLPDPVVFARAKVASLQSEIDDQLRPRRSPIVELRRCEKTAENLRIERGVLDLAWCEAVDGVAKLASYLGWDHDAFEKNAIALFGGDVLPELNAVRHRRKMAALGGDVDPEALHAKLASLQQQWIGIEDEPSALLKTAMAAREKYAKILDQEKQNDAVRATLKKVVRHA